MWVLCIGVYNGGWGSTMEYKLFQIFLMLMYVNVNIVINFIDGKLKCFYTWNIIASFLKRNTQFIY